MLSETVQVLTPKADIVFPPDLLSEGVSEFSVDSLCLNIPLSEVEVLNPALTAQIQVYEVDKDTGEVYTQRDKLSGHHIKAGDTDTGCHREYAVQSSKRGDILILRIWFSSKSLGSLYFLGITPETLPLIYQRIQEDAVVSLSYESLLRGRPTDFDLKRDFLFHQDREVLLSFYRHLQRNYVPTHYKSRGVHIFGDSKGLNVGLDLNKRGHHKSIVATFLKSYFKGGLLLTKDRVFFEQYLEGVEEDFLRVLHRQEFTVSGREHSKALGLGACSTLEQVFEVPQSQWEEAVALVLQANFTKEPVRRMKDSEQKHSLRQEIILGVLQALLTQGLTVPQIRDIVTSRVPDRKQRSRANKEVSEMLRVLSEEGFSTEDKSQTPERLKEQADSFDRLFRLFNY